MIPHQNGPASMLDPMAEDFDLPGGVGVTVVDLGDGDPPTVQLTAPDAPLTVTELSALAEQIEHLRDRLDHGGLRRVVGS